MRYIISESRMDSLIYDYLSKNYTPDTGWFGNMWKPVMVRWFEDNTGLKVRELATGLD